MIIFLSGVSYGRYASATFTIAFISRHLSPAETRYHSNELECLALIWALQQFRTFLYGREFSVYTDSNALRWLVNKKNVEGKFARWIMALQEHRFQVHHIKEKLNVVADALSQSPVDAGVETDPTERALCTLVGEFYPPEEIAVLQQADLSLRKIILQLQSSPTELTKNYIYHQGVLYRKNQERGHRHLLMVPSIMRRDILTSCHDGPTGGHFGYSKTLLKVQSRFWWPKYL